MVKIMLELMSPEIKDMLYRSRCKHAAYSGEVADSQILIHSNSMKGRRKKGRRTHSVIVVCVQGRKTCSAIKTSHRADISRSHYVAIAMQPVHRLQIRPIVHN